MSSTASATRPVASLISFAVGAAALLLVLVHFGAGPFAPQQRASVTVGEIAAEMRKAATRKLLGKPNPAPKAKPWTIDRVLNLVAAMLAGLAVIAGIAGLVRRENWRLAAGGIVLGAGAVAFQFFTWAVLMVLGGLILIAIIQNIGDIIGDGA